MDERENSESRNTNKNKLIDYTKMENVVNSKTSALGMVPTLPESPTVKKFK